MKHSNYKPNSCPYDLGSKGGFQKQANLSKQKTPYDLNRAVRKNNSSCECRSESKP
jgi:hypothetical protein